MNEFRLFSPSSWFNDGLELTSVALRREPHSMQRRKTTWKTVFAASTLTIGVVFSSGSLAFDPKWSSITVSELSQPPDISTASSALHVQHDRSFTSLFDSFLSGRSLLPSDRVRDIARLAAQVEPDVDLDAWAARLAQDVAKADD